MLCWFFNLLSTFAGWKFWSPGDARQAVVWEKLCFWSPSETFVRRAILDRQKCDFGAKNTFFGYFWSQLLQPSFLDKISLENNIEACIQMIRDGFLFNRCWQTGRFVVHFSSSLCILYVLSLYMYLLWTHLYFSPIVLY